MFIPSRRRTGPLTMTAGDAPMVVAITPWTLNSSVQAASSAVMTTGRYSGFAPAITALMATFSTVAGAMFGGTCATTSCGSRPVPRSIRRTRSGVGGTTGRPSVSPWSNRNSCTSSCSAISITRDASAPLRRAASLAATCGSTLRAPQPGRRSGKASQSMAASSARPANSRALAIRLRHWALSNPKVWSTQAPSLSYRNREGTVSRSASQETSSAPSSSIGTVRSCRCRSTGMSPLTCAITQTLKPSPAARCGTSMSGNVR